MKEKYNDYVRRHICEPNFAEASIQWKETGERCDGYVFALNETPKQFLEEDDKVFFYADGIDGLCALAVQDNGEDFILLSETVNFFEKL